MQETTTNPLVKAAFEKLVEILQNEAGHIIKGRDQMGPWWDTAMVERLCRDHHLDCQFSATHTQIAVSAICLP